MRICKCGGIIRREGKPYWDVLESCDCKNPEAVATEGTVVSTDGTFPLEANQQ